MKITAVTAFEFRRPLSGTHWNPVERWRERRIPLIAVEGDNGMAGFGEGWAPQAMVPLFFDHLASSAVGRLLGRDAGDIETIWDELWACSAPAEAPWLSPSVTSAVDLALWDLAGKAAGEPVMGLHGAQRTRVPVYASGGLYADGKGLAALAAEMASYVAVGFNTVKMKIGALPLEQDLDRVATVRSAIGDTELLVDAVGQYDRDTALEACGRLADMGVQGIQAPLPPADVEGMAMLQRLKALAIIGVETEYRPDMFRHLAAAGAVSWLQFNPGLAGGLTQGLRLAALAEEHGLPVTPQNHGTALLHAASLHLGAISANVSTVEHHMFHDHLRPCFPAALDGPRDGMLELRDTPGWGLDDIRSSSRVRTVARYSAGS